MLNFNLGSLKASFLDYLEKLNDKKQNGEEKFQLDNFNFSQSIFEYSDAFEDFLNEELGYSKNSLSCSVEDLTSAENMSSLLSEINSDTEEVAIEDAAVEETAIEDTAQEANMTENTEDATAQEATNAELTSEDAIMAMLAGMFENEEFKDSIDGSVDGSKKDGKIDEAELLSFIDNLKGQDGDENNISLEDLIKTGQNYSKEDANTEKTQEPTIDIKLDDTESAQPVSNSANTGGSTGGNTGGSPRGNTGGGYNSGGNTGLGDGGVKSKNYSGMQLPALYNEQTTQQEALDTSKNEKNNIQNGSDSRIEGLEGEKDTLQEDYLKALEEDENLDKETKEMLAQAMEDINTQEGLINETSTQINDTNAQIAQQTAVIANIDSQIGALNSALGALGSSDDPEKQAEIDAKRTELEQQIADAEAQRETEQAKLDELQTTLQGLNDTLTEQQDKLTQLNTSLTEKEENGEKVAIEYSEATKAILDNFQAKQKEIVDTKTSLIGQIDTKMSALQSEIDKINTEINKKEAMATKRQYSTSEYNEEMGLKLVECAENTARKMNGSRGYCAAGVHYTILEAYGISMNGNGEDWDSNMDQLVEQGLFKEVTVDYPSSGDLKTLPPGAIVCWEDTTNSGGGGAEWGHVTVATGAQYDEEGNMIKPSGEISDHYAPTIYTSIGGGTDQYRVYIPV